MKRKLGVFLVCALLISTIAGCGSQSNEASSEVESSSSESVSSETSTTGGTATSGLVDTLSDDIYSYQIQIDDLIYQFPLPYETMINSGWVSKDDDTELLDSNRMRSVWTMKKGDLSVYVSITNFDDSALPYKDCYITGINIDEYGVKQEGAKIVLPGGIVFNEATVEDIKNQYGTPSSESDLDSAVYMDYEQDMYQEISLTVSKDKGVLSSVDMENAAKPADFKGSGVAATVSTDSVYTAPTAMSDNFDDFVVDFGGNLYQLPAPISEFQKNGWTIKNESGSDTIPGKNYIWATFSKDNQKMKVMVYNYSASATTIENCFAVSVKASVNENNTPIIVSKGITIGSTKAELETALTGLNYEKEESGSFIYYTYQPKDDSSYEYDFLVNIESGLVSKIEVQSKPSYSEFEV